MLKVIALIIPIFLGSLGVLQTVVYFLIKRKFDNFGIIAGKITFSKFIDQTDTDGKREIDASIKFSYTIAGKEYESSTPLLKGYEMFPSYGYYHELAKRYPLGEIVNVHFYRKNPNMSFLEIAPLSKSSTILAPLISVGSIIIIAAYFAGAGSFIEQYIPENGGLGGYINSLIYKPS
jgi:hypothetical protein